jgi:cell wall-associated NlpC family hydrolase
LLAFGAAFVSGCGALNPLRGVEPGPDAAWTRPAANARPAVGTRPAARPAAMPAPRPAARPSHAVPAAARPAPATSPAARPARRTREAAGAAPATGASVSAGTPVLAGPAALAQHLRAEGADWIGTPYRFGGQSRAGMDCSGFVGTLMREALGVQLTRSTATMVYEGEAVDKEDLLPGDLVFFRRGGTRHVGVYLGEGEFIHASSSNGVIVSRLDEGYYQRNYWTARRVLDDPRRFMLAGEAALVDVPAGGASATRPAAPRGTPDGSARGAW